MGWGRAVRLGWAGAAALDLAALVLLVASASHVPTGETAVALATVVGAAVPTTAGTAVLVRVPRHPVGRLLLATGYGFTAKAVLSSYAVWGLVAGHAVPAASGVAWLQGWVLLLVYPAGLTCLLLAFPAGRLSRPGARPVVGVAVVGGLLVLAERLVEPAPVVAGLHLRLLEHNPTAVHAAWVDALSLGWPLSLLGLVLAVADLVRRARRDERAARAARVLAGACLLLGLLAGAALVAALAAPARAGGTATWVQLAFVLQAGVVVPVAMAAAVIDESSFRVERLLDRTLTWTGLSVLVAAGYVGLVLYLTALIGAGSGEALRVVATVAVAIGFQPLRGVVQRAVTRVVYGPDGDPRAAVLGLARRDVEPGRRLDETARALQRALGAERVSVVLDALGAGTAGPGLPTVSYPLVWDGERVGRLEVDAGSAAGLPTGRARLRDEVADLLARAGHEARQRDRLAFEQARRLAAAADERRRLRHDLHDGVGPWISGLRMTVAAAQRQAGVPGRVQELLAQAATGLEQLAREVRRVLDGLGPAALEGHGLRSALAEAVRAVGLEAVLDLDPALDEVDDAVARAVLRIAQEALHNVAQHSGVSACTVTVRVGDELELVVSDAGVGSAPGRTGVGTTSMRARAAELGGAVAVWTPPGGGTRVRVTLPLRAVPVA